ncbi:hypothetical protein E4U54_006341 [Claviceps lovelessii]|nr:hypothetical protein E4U54_006341 [Claviceps lovelessii]
MDRYGLGGLGGLDAERTAGGWKVETPGLISQAKTPDARRQNGDGDCDHLTTTCHGCGPCKCRLAALKLASALQPPASSAGARRTPPREPRLSARLPGPPTQGP